MEQARKVGDRDLFFFPFFLFSFFFFFNVALGYPARANRNIISKRGSRGHLLTSTGVTYMITVGTDPYLK